MHVENEDPPNHISPTFIDHLHKLFLYLDPHQTGQLTGDMIYSLQTTIAENLGTTVTQ